jgi:hypothetical protein
MITTYWAKTILDKSHQSEVKLRSQRGLRRIKNLSHIAWDDSTTPPTLLSQKLPWKAIKAGAPMHPFFIKGDELYSVESVTKPCFAVKVFSKSPTTD